MVRNVGFVTSAVNRVTLFLVGLINGYWARMSKGEMGQKSDM